MMNFKNSARALIIGAMMSVTAFTITSRADAASKEELDLWCREAEKHGNPDALFNIALNSVRGTNGFEWNAYNLYLALELSYRGTTNPEVRKYRGDLLKKIESDLLPEDVTQAKKDAKRWQAGNKLPLVGNTPCNKD